MGLLAFVRKRSLQTKSFLSLSIIGSLTLLGMLLGYLCTKTVAADYERMLASNARFELLLTRIMARMNQLSRDEYAYIQNRDPGFLQHREHTLQHIFDALKELAQVDQSIIPRDDLKAFEGRILQHQDYFKIIAQHLTEEGDAESGFLGELRKAAHRAEVGNANLSAEKAELSYHITAEGKQAVNAMRETMVNIREAMGAMIGQNNQANQRMQTILAVIEKIVERTQVINDIVFQTRLLAFNASVEAARAGEQGKGFAVVAEEVGNLARMSGEASKAITALLQDSRQEVLVIIEESRQQSSQLTEKVTEKVDAGVQIATRCDEILNEVVDHVGFVKTLMGEIAGASQEEAGGIHNITIAMNELDQTTTLNSDMAHQTMSISNMLSQEAAALHASVDVLSRIVMGDAKVVRRQATRNDEPGAHDNDDSVSMAA